MLGNYHYPDTSSENTKIATRINKNSYAGPPRSRFESGFRRGKISFFFMPRKLFDDYGLNEAKKRFKPTEKLIVSKADLEKANWEIHYPFKWNKTFKPVPHDPDKSEF